jgi:hypothetical protein
VNTDAFRVEKRRARWLVINDETGERYPYGSKEAAEDAIQAFREEKEPASDEVKARRELAKAYRDVERDPLLRLMKHIFPRPGEAMRNTLASQDEAMKVIGRCMTIASSDATAHAELNKPPGQRRVSKAKIALDQKGADTREQIAERWNAHSDVPERKRTCLIARELKINPRHVRRLRPR